MAKYICKQCGKEFKRSGTKLPVFCSRGCQGVAKREAKGISREWLEKKYIKEELSTYAIAKLVNRDPKRVYDWLKDYNIPTRTRSEVIQKNSWWALGYESALKGRSLSEETKNKISETRKERKIKGSSGKNNGMYGRRGPQSVNWKGGKTPERQAFYATIEWRECVKKVWERYRGYCKRCGEKNTGKKQYDIHHIISFAVSEFRAELSNLVLLCHNCHLWVHSKKNKDKELIKEYE